MRYSTIGVKVEFGSFLVRYLDCVYIHIKVSFLFRYGYLISYIIKVAKVARLIMISISITINKIKPIVAIVKKTSFLLLLFIIVIIYYCYLYCLLLLILLLLLLLLLSFYY